VTLVNAPVACVFVGERRWAAVRMADRSLLDRDDVDLRAAHGHHEQEVVQLVAQGRDSLHKGAVGSLVWERSGRGGEKGECARE